MGRSAQLAALRDAWQEAQAGRPRVVFVEGEAGTGKTSLVRQLLAELPADVSLHRAEADELAADLPYAVIGQLADDLPGEPFAAGLALLRALGERGEGDRVVVVVEDLHWADHASRAALLTAARRLTVDRFLLVVTSRPVATPDGWDRLRSDPRCVRIGVGALTAADVGELAGDAGRPLTRTQAERLQDHTGGHPLWVRVLLEELTPAQLQSGNELPVPRSLAATTVARLSALPADAVAVASALAVLGTPATLPLIARVAAVADPGSAWQVLLDSGLVEWSPDSALSLGRFAHPLYRAAVYADLSVPRRMSLHRAAAAALSPGPALAHRVAAAAGPDQGLADELAATARTQSAAGLPGRAATYLLWAQSVAAEPTASVRYLLGAVRALVADRQLNRAQQLREQVETAELGASRSVVLGVLAWEAGQAGAAERWWRDALSRAAPDDDEAAQARTALGRLYLTQGRGQAAVDIAAESLNRPMLPAAAERGARVAAAVGTGLLHGAPAGLSALTGRIPAAPDQVDPTDVDLLVVRGTLGFYAGQTGTAIRDLRAGIRVARGGALTGELERAHIHLAQLLFLAGEWDDALQQGRTALSLIQGDRHVWMQAQANAVLARLHAGRGEWARAQEYADHAATAATALGTAEAVFTARIAAATLARAQVRPAGVVAALVDLTAQEPPMLTSLGWWPMLVSALVELGELAPAAAQLDRLAAAAAARGVELRMAILAARAELRAAQGDPDRAQAAFAAAAEQITGDEPILDRIQLHHRWGRLLVARGRRREGRAVLRVAVGLAAGCGAAPFLRQVEADLQVGPRVEPASGRTSASLTDREHDVVTLVTRGMTNKEVAAELYVSVKAVEYHLGNVYAKLGVRSRRELGRISSTSTR